MDFEWGSQDIIDKHENKLIHLFFYMFDYDYRNGVFSDESSIYDMGICGLKDEHFILAYHRYEECIGKLEKLPKYKECQKKYFSILYQIESDVFKDKFKIVYGIELPEKIHLLKDIVKYLDKNIKRNWDEENIFIIKKLDVQSIQNEDEEKPKKIINRDEKIIPFPVSKKSTDDEIREGFNEFLMMSRLNMSWKEARAQVLINEDKYDDGKIFEPYYPEKSKKNKFKK